MRRVRTSNQSELQILGFLESEGYSVYKRGWPDFIAVKGDEVRFIEVKPPQGYPHLKPDQKKVASILSKFGITVEIMTP